MLEIPGRYLECCLSFYFYDQQRDSLSCRDENLLGLQCFFPKDLGFLVFFKVNHVCAGITRLGVLSVYDFSNGSNNSVIHFSIT